MTKSNASVVHAANGTVDIQTSMDLARLFKRAVRMLGVELVWNDVYHANPVVSLEASNASRELCELYDALTLAGVG